MLAEQVKDKYRLYFANVKSYVKMSILLEELGINNGNFSAFMNGNNARMSIENLTTLEKYTINKLKIILQNQTSKN